MTRTAKNWTAAILVNVIVAAGVAVANPSTAKNVADDAGCTYLATMHFVGDMHLVGLGPAIVIRSSHPPRCSRG